MTIHNGIVGVLFLLVAICWGFIVPSNKLFFYSIVAVAMVLISFLIYTVFQAIYVIVYWKDAYYGRIQLQARLKILVVLGGIIVLFYSMCLCC